MQGHLDALNDVVAKGSQNVTDTLLQFVLGGKNCGVCLRPILKGGIPVQSSLGMMHVCAGSVRCADGFCVMYTGGAGTDDDVMENLRQFHVPIVRSAGKRKAADADAHTKEDKKAKKKAKEEKKKKEERKKKDERKSETVEIKAKEVVAHRVINDRAQVQMRYASGCGTAVRAFWMDVDDVNGDREFDSCVAEHLQANPKAAKEVRLGNPVCDIKNEKGPCLGGEIITCAMHSRECLDRKCDGCTSTFCVSMCTGCITEGNHTDADNATTTKTSRGGVWSQTCDCCDDRCFVCLERGMRHGDIGDGMQCSECKGSYKGDCGDGGKCNFCAPCRLCDAPMTDGDGHHRCTECSRRTHVGCCAFVDSLEPFLKDDMNMDEKIGKCSTCNGLCGTCFDEVTVTGATVSCKKCGATVCDDCVGKKLVDDELCFTCAHSQEPVNDGEGVRIRVFKNIKDLFGRNADDFGDVPANLRIALSFVRGTLKRKSWAWRN